jgi:hypothetical protein
MRAGSGVQAEQACVPRQASPPAGMGTEQARPPTAAKPTVAAADPLRLQPGSAWARAAKTKGAQDSPRPRQIRMPLPPPPPIRRGPRGPSALARPTRRQGPPSPHPTSDHVSEPVPVHATSPP